MTKLPRLFSGQFSSLVIATHSLPRQFARRGAAPTGKAVAGAQANLQIFLPGFDVAEFARDWALCAQLKHVASDNRRSVYLTAIGLTPFAWPAFQLGRKLSKW